MLRKALLFIKLKKLIFVCPIFYVNYSIHCGSKSQARKPKFEIIFKLTYNIEK